MWSILKALVVLAAVLVVFRGRPARAADVEVKVPFPFVVHGQTLPAGQYRVEHEADGVLLLRGEKNNKAALFVMTMPAEGRDPAGDQPSLTFVRDETNYRLAGVWESESDGNTIGKR